MTYSVRSVPFSRNGVVQTDFCGNGVYTINTRRVKRRNQERQSCVGDKSKEIQEISTLQRGVFGCI